MGTSTLLRTAGSSPTDGVTLIEIMVVMVIGAILVGGAVALLSTGYADRAAEEAASRIATDIAFAQAEAISHRSERLIVFDTVNNAYAIFAAGDTLLHPVTRAPLVVDLSALYQGSGLTLESASYGGSDTLRFDRDGIPASGGQLALQGAESRWLVTVADATGRIATSETPSDIVEGKGKGSPPEKDPPKGG